MKPIRFTKENGKITVGRKRFLNAVESLEDGEWGAKFDEWKSTRSNLQNAFIHVCFNKYGEFVGLTDEEAKDYLKKRYGLNRLYRDPKTGKQEVRVRDTRDYNMEEMTVFIDRILTHFEHDCGFIIDPELRKQYKLDHETGELEEI